MESPGKKSTKWNNMEKKIQRQKKRKRQIENQTEEEATNLTKREQSQKDNEVSLGRGRASKASTNDFRKLEAMQRRRKKEKQYIRAVKKKPRKYEKVLPKIENPHAMIRPSPAIRHLQHMEEFEKRKKLIETEKFNDLCPEEKAEFRSEMQWEDNRPKRLKKLNEEIDAYMQRYAAWQVLSISACQTSGESLGIFLNNSFPKNDVRSFLKTSTEGNRIRIDKELDRRYYSDVLQDQSITNAQRERCIINTKRALEQKRNKENSNICEIPNCEGIVCRDESQAHFVCSKCGMVQKKVLEIMNNINFANRDQYSKGTLPYEPLSHFKEFISRLQGTERTEIPVEVIDAVKQRCIMHHIDVKLNPEALTYSRCRHFLQQEGYASFFENICQIICRVTGVAPVVLTADEVSNLTMIFLEIQQPYQEVKGNRQNMLSYSYTTYKSCQLLGITRALPFLPLFKDLTNLAKADAIWKKICAAREYEFIESA